MGGTPPPVNILLVEDNPKDVEITRRGLEKRQVRHELTVARDGQEALDILFCRGRDGVPKPGFILLDLNLPKVDGREVLERIRADSSLANIPVVVMTVSTRGEDIARCYELGVKTFICKPPRSHEFILIATLAQLYGPRKPYGSLAR